MRIPNRTGYLLLSVAFLLMIAASRMTDLCPPPFLSRERAAAAERGEGERAWGSDSRSNVAPFSVEGRGGEDEDEDEGKEEEEKEEEEELSDDITFLFAIINMNRRTHMGIENYSFEADYLEQLKGFLTNFRPEKVQIIIQRRYFDHIKSHLYEGVDVRFVELEELRAWPDYPHIEAIRNSPWWTAATPWLRNVPQGYSDLYNPIVSHKLLWLRDLAVLNPFKTRYFVWLDSGGICTPRLNPTSGMHLEEFKPKVKYYMDKFFITVTSYAMGTEIHGCYREAILKLTHDQAPCYITKGWLMGGQKEHLVKVSQLYEYVVNKSLELGCLGTEETLLTMCYYRRPDLFHVHHNVDRLDGPFDGGGDVCHMLWVGWPPQEKNELPMERWLREDGNLGQSVGMVN